MSFNNEQMQDIQKICKAVVDQEMLAEEARKYLEEKYGVTNCHFSLDGKAILQFPNGKTLNYGNLKSELPGYYDSENPTLDEGYIVRR